MMNTRVLGIAAAVAGALLSGCTSVGQMMNVGETEFSCPKKETGGVTCLTAREVYKATDASDRARVTHIDGKAVDGVAAPPAKDSAGKSENLVLASSDDKPAARAIPTIDKPIPIRTQAKVLRIMVAPWEDADGDLHVPGLVFTEIEPRRWNLGDGMVRKTNSVNPLAGNAAPQLRGMLSVINPQNSAGRGQSTQLPQPGTADRKAPQRSGLPGMPVYPAPRSTSDGGSDSAGGPVSMPGRAGLDPILDR